MRALICWLMFSAAGLLLPALAQARPVTNLYSARVEVADHSAPALARASRTALTRVLIKLSGSRGVLAAAQIEPALADSQRYLQRYQYLRTETGARKVEIHFDPQSVNALLTRAQQPLWGANRPPLLLWLIVKEGGEQYFGSDQTAPKLLAAVQHELARRGVPVVLPLYDLDDARALRQQELWRLDRRAIAQASARYAVDNILVGRLHRRADGRWTGDWLYLHDEGRVTHSFYGKPALAASAAGADFVADHMAARYAVAPTETGAGDVLVRVDKLHDLADYRAVLRLLGAIELVDSAHPAYMEGSSAVFRLRTLAQAGQLHRIISVDRRLQRMELAEPLSLELTGPTLVYRWSR